MDNSKANVSKKGKNMNGGNRAETEYDEAEVEIDFSNVPKEMLDFIIKTTKDAIKNYTDTSINYFIKIAKSIKLSLDNEKLGIWNVIVGSEYGSWISYDKGFLMFFRIREINVLIFRYGIDETSNKKDN